jgi:hypothetical protein
MKADREVIHFINNILNAIEMERGVYDIDYENELDRIEVIK